MSMELDILRLRWFMSSFLQFPYESSVLELPFSFHKDNHYHNNSITNIDDIHLTACILLFQLFYTPY